MAVTTIEDFVEALGGNAHLADVFGIKASAVNAWKIRNHISSGYHLRLLAMARRNKIDVSPEVFGLNFDEAHELFPSKSVSIAA